MDDGSNSLMSSSQCTQTKCSSSGRSLGQDTEYANGESDDIDGAQGRETSTWLDAQLSIRISDAVTASIPVNAGVETMYLWSGREDGVHPCNMHVLYELVHPF